MSSNNTTCLGFDTNADAGVDRVGGAGAGAPTLAIAPRMVSRMDSSVGVSILNVFGFATVLFGMLWDVVGCIPRLIL